MPDTETPPAEAPPDEALAESLPPPTNVIAAIARVEAEIGGIEKLTRQERQRRGMHADTGDKGVSWAYRGIDQIAQAAQPLLGRYGVVIVPTVTRHVVDEITINNNPWTDTTVFVKWKIYGPGGVTDKITSRTIGLGRDNSDKGFNKAMTNAYKNLLLRLLSIGDPKDDQDHTAYDQPDRNSAPEPPPDDPIHKLWTDLVAAIGDNEDRVEAVKQVGAAFDVKVTEGELARHASVRGEIERLVASWQPDETPDDPDEDARSDTPDDADADSEAGEPQPATEPSDAPETAAEASDPAATIDDVQFNTLIALLHEFPKARQSQVSREFKAAHGHKIEDLPADLYDYALSWLSEKVEAEPKPGPDPDQFDPAAR